MGTMNPSDVLTNQSDLIGNHTHNKSATDAADSVTADSSLALFNYIVNVYIDGLLCLLGFFGNVMILVVLRRNKTQTSNSILLCGLAVYDMCFLCYVVFYVVLRSVHAYTASMPWLDVANPYIVAFVLPFGWTSQTCTIWMMMMVTVDRFWIVSRPLTGSLRCNATTAKRITVGVGLAAILFNAVRWPRYYFVAFHYGSNSTFVSHVDAYITGWNDDLYLKIYHISLTFFFLFIIPLGVIIILNAKLVGYLKRAGKRHDTMVQKQSSKVDNPKQQQQKSTASATSTNLTRMLVIMITIFVLCELPDFIAGIIGAGKFQINQTIYHYYAAIKEAMLVFNSAVNFYLYLLLYRNFRLSFLELFGVEKKGQRAGPGNLTATSSLASSINTIAKTVTFNEPEYINEKGFNTRL